MAFIYALIHPETKEIRYVGKTQGPLSFRYKRHTQDSKRGESHVYRWWRSLGDDITPEMIILEENPLDNLSDAEKRWILKGKAEGWRLTNMTPGGDGGSGAMSPEN